MEKKEQYAEDSECTYLWVWCQYVRSPSGLFSFLKPAKFRSAGPGLFLFFIKLF